MAVRSSKDAEDSETGSCQNDRILLLMPFLRVAFAVCGLVLILATRPLWFGRSDFPAVPMFEMLVTAPTVLDDTLSYAMCAAFLMLIGTFTARLLPRIRTAAAGRLRSIDGCAFLLFASTGTLLVLLNQHRLQPWMYHFLLLSPVLACGSQLHRAGSHRPHHALRRAGSHRPKSMLAGGNRPYAKHSLGLTLNSPESLILILTGSIYAWSAWSKLDASFAQTHGRTFVDAITNVLGIRTTFWSDSLRTTTALCLPVGELLIALSFCAKRTRKLGLFASLLMHGALILAVGPWGLDQEWGVVIWNIFFIIQNAALLWMTNEAAEELPSRNGEDHGLTSQDDVITASRMRLTASRLISITATTTVLCAAILPLLRTVDRFDHWPSWAVYASGIPRTHVLIKTDCVDALPDHVRPFVQERLLDDGWSWVRVDLWSLKSVHAPIYPQDRFHIAVARTLSELASERDAIRIILESSADRWTAARVANDVTGDASIITAAKSLSMNTKPRSSL